MSSIFLPTFGISGVFQHASYIYKIDILERADYGKKKIKESYSPQRASVIDSFLLSSAKCSRVLQKLKCGCGAGSYYFSGICKLNEQCFAFSEVHSLHHWPWRYYRDHIRIRRMYLEVQRKAYLEVGAHPQRKVDQSKKKTNNISAHKFLVCFLLFFFLKAPSSHL